MTAALLSGDPIAKAVTAEAAAALSSLRVKPRVAAVHNEKSAPVRAYMKRQRAACESAGIPYDLHAIAEMSESDVAALIGQLAGDPEITGITIHQPMPAGFNEERLLQMVPAKKDVEATHPENLGRLELGVPGPRPVAAEAAVEILRSHRPDCRGLDAGDMLKPGAIVLDIGINRVPEGGLVGDVDFDSAKEVASAITPVPGGVGPVAVALFLRNVVACARLA